MSTDKQNNENELAMAILNGLSGPNACKAADERRRMIPLHIADQAVAACEKEIAELKAEVERLKEGNDCLDKMHEKEMERSAWLREEFNRTTACCRGLESDLSHARVEISFLKAEVERLRASSFVTAVPVEQYERVIKAGDAMAQAFVDCLVSQKRFPSDSPSLKRWNAAKEGKPSV